MYKISGTGVTRLADGACIPNDTGNRDWVEYKAWCLKGNTAAPELSPADITAKRRAAIAARRFKAETAGLSVGGVSVYTDRTTQNKLTAAAFRASRDHTYVVDWKLLDDSFITLNAEFILFIADTVGDYVQACYTREGVLSAMLSAGTYTDEMLDQGWPSEVVEYVTG